MSTQHIVGVFDQRRMSMIQFSLIISLRLHSIIGDFNQRRRSTMQCPLFKSLCLCSIVGVFNQRKMSMIECSLIISVYIDNIVGVLNQSKMSTMQCPQIISLCLHSIISDFNQRMTMVQCPLSKSLCLHSMASVFNQWLLLTVPVTALNFHMYAQSHYLFRTIYKCTLYTYCDYTWLASITISHHTHLFFFKHASMWCKFANTIEFRFSRRRHICHLNSWFLIDPAVPLQCAVHIPSRQVKKHTQIWNIFSLNALAAIKTGGRLAFSLAVRILLLSFLICPQNMCITGVALLLLMVPQYLSRLGAQLVTLRTFDTFCVY